MKYRAYFGANQVVEFGRGADTSAIEYATTQAKKQDPPIDIKRIERVDELVCVIWTKEGGPVQVGQVTNTHRIHGLRRGIVTMHRIYRSPYGQLRKDREMSELLEKLHRIMNPSISKEDFSQIVQSLDN
jgi:hypothetical protein